jgi:hypothetical protein
MIDKQQIVDLLIDAEFEFWSHDVDPPSRRDLLVSISRYNLIAEKLVEYLQHETATAWQKGYDSAFSTWNKNSAEFYK